MRDKKRLSERTRRIMAVSDEPSSGHYCPEYGFIVGWEREECNNCMTSREQ